MFFLLTDPILPLMAHCFLLIRDVYDTQLEHSTLLTRQLVLLESYRLELELNDKRHDLEVAVHAQEPNAMEITKVEYSCKLLNIFIEYIPKIDLPYELNLVCVRIKVTRDTTNAITTIITTIVAALFSAFLRSQSSR